MTLIIVLWVFSVFVFAKRRFHLALQKGVSFPNALNDRATMLYLKGTGMVMLLLIFYMKNLNLLFITFL
jgi:hypothetical protein